MWLGVGCLDRASHWQIEGFLFPHALSVLASCRQYVTGCELIVDDVQVGLDFHPASGYANGHNPLPVEVKFERVEDDMTVVYTIRYVPNLPGTYSIDVKVNHETASTLMAQVSPANPPQPLSAAFEDSLVAMKVAFDRDTNKAGMVRYLAVPADGLLLSNINSIPLFS